MGMAYINYPNNLAIFKIIYVKINIRGIWKVRSMTSQIQMLLLDFSLTVKAATLIFISRCGSAISSAKVGQSGFIYNLVKVNKLLAAQTCVYFMKILTVYTLNSHLFTLKAHYHKMYGFLCRPLNYLKPHR